MKAGRLFLLLALMALLFLLGCAGTSKEVITRQREGLSCPVPYSTALQTIIFTLTKRGLAIETIDKENGLITTRPQQIREEKYFYQIAVRPVGTSVMLVSVICNWSISPGLDVNFYGIPSAVAKSKSMDLEIELANDIERELLKITLPVPAKG